MTVSIKYQTGSRVCNGCNVEFSINNFLMVQKFLKSRLGADLVLFK